MGAEHTWAFNTDYINGGTKSITTLIKAQRVINNQALKRFQTFSINIGRSRTKQTQFPYSLLFILFKITDIDQKKKNQK